MINLILQDISILIVGSGSIGNRHAKNLLNLVKVVKIYSSRFKKGGKIEKLDKVIYVKNLYDEIDCSDGVLIANRTDKHLKIANYALKKKKHVFIEKPLSQNMKGIKKIEELTKNNPELVESGFMLRFHPNLIFLKKIISEQKYGKIHYVRSSVGQYLPEWRKDFDYRNGYAARRKWGGGVTLDLIHEIDLARWLFGEVDLVSAMLDKTPELEIETESIAHLNLKMDSKFLIQLSLDYVRPCFQRNIEIVCSKGTILWNYKEGKIKLEDKNGNILILHEVEKNFDRNDMFLKEIIHFINNINGKNSKDASNLEDAVKALKICCAAHLSHKKQRFICPDKISYDYVID